MILMYHNILPLNAPNGYLFQSISMNVNDFENQIIWLTKFFKIVPLKEYLNFGSSRPKNLLAITFDDGTEVTYTSLCPIVEKHKIPITIFVTTCQLNNGPLIWAASINALCYENEYEQIELNGESYKLRTLKQRNIAKNKLILAAIESGDPVKFIKVYSAKYPLQDKILFYYRGMNDSNFEHVRTNKYIEIEAHSVNHYHLTTLSNEHQEYEISNSRKILEDKIGKPITMFAYPSGDYNSDTIELLVKNKFTYGIAVKSKNIAKYQYEVPRVGVFSHNIIYLFFKILKSITI
jgi:peptidoglycan/xylan/chitin deacetylase (PgdA/CDA1 family)